MGARGRTCIGCRRVRSKESLVRLVRLADGSADVDPSGKVPGRGAYLCADRDCLEAGRRRIAGALRARTVDLDAIRRGLAEAGPAPSGGRES